MFRDGRHVYDVRVYFEDTDAGGIAYHASYLRFAERARTELLRERGVAHADLIAEHGLFFVVRRAKLDYLRPAMLDDALAVITETLAVGGASALLRQSFFRGHEAAPLVVLDLSLAVVRRADHRPARLPARWRAALAGLLMKNDENKE